MKLTSRLIQRGIDSVVLAVEIPGGTIETTITLGSSAKSIPDRPYADGNVQTHMTVIQKSSKVSKSIADALKQPRPGDVAIFICQTPKTYDVTCLELGYDNSRTVFDAQ
jgi:hypothetical protein